jgi:hypothetical protein
MIVEEFTGNKEVSLVVADSAPVKDFSFLFNHNRAAGYKGTDIFNMGGSGIDQKTENLNQDPIVEELVFKQGITFTAVLLIMMVNLVCWK